MIFRPSTVRKFQVEATLSIIIYPTDGSEALLVKCEQEADDHKIITPKNVTDTTAQSLGSHVPLVLNVHSAP